MHCSSRRRASATASALPTPWRRVRLTAPPPPSRAPGIAPALGEWGQRAPRGGPGGRPADAGALLAELGLVRPDLGLRRVPPAEITGLFGALVKRMTRRKFGRTPDSLGVMWHNQRVLKTMFGFFGKTDKWDACDKQLKSFAHMAAAILAGCRLCLDLGYFHAHNEGPDVAKCSGTHLR